MRWFVGIVLALLFMGNVPFVSGQVITSTSISTGITLVPALPTNKSAIQTGFGTDSGREHYSYQSNGFTMTVPGGGAFTLGLPSLVFPSAIQTTSFLKNSSEYAIQVISSTNTQSALFTIHFKNSTQYNQKLISVTGISSTTTSISFPLNFKGTPQVCNSGSSVSPINKLPVGPCTTACFSGACFSWQDASSFNPSYNNQTHVITFEVSNSFNIDPLALDGSASNHCSSVASCTVTLTTTNSPDVIVVACNCFNTGSFTISDTSSLSWTARVTKVCNVPATCNDGGIYIEWVANASSALSSDVITASGPASTFFGLIAFGVSGAQTSSSSFDTGATVQDTLACTTSGFICVFNMSTNNANDFIFHLGYAGLDIPAITAGGTCGASTCTLIKDVGFAGIENWAQYFIVSATQSGINLQANVAIGGCSNPTCQFGATDGFFSIGDAIKQKPASTVTQSIKTPTLPNGAPFGTITITGCAPGNSTYTANPNTKTYTLTASCTVTLTTSGVSSHTRYMWNVSPHPTATSAITFQTCASGTCSLYSNNTYYQLSNNFTANPQQPNHWDGQYPWFLSGTYLGTFESTASGFFACAITSTGGGKVTCSTLKQWFDYNQHVAESNPIGGSWFALGNDSFQDTTGNNIHNVNFIQSKASSPDFDWLLLTPVFIIPLVVLLRRKIR